MGGATSNSILVVSFATENDRRSGFRCGCSRSRIYALSPVLMTALAMIIGMVPMALGLGDGGEQNAPLAGR